MRSHVCIAIGGCAWLLSAAPALAQAGTQAQCPEGRTASGLCVDAALGSLIRERVRVFTQPRLSYSGPAVAPAHDRQYEVLRDWGQGLTREIYSPCLANFCP
jgi:hypothetical protein